MKECILDITYKMSWAGSSYENVHTVIFHDLRTTTSNEEIYFARWSSNFETMFQHYILLNSRDVSSGTI